MIEGRRTAKLTRGRPGSPSTDGGAAAPSREAGADPETPASEAAQDLVAQRSQALARAFRAGRNEAFAELVDLFKERFYRIAYRVLGNPEDALDVTQDAFVRIHKGIATWDERAAFFSWSYRIVTNLAIDSLRKKGRDRKAREGAALERPEAHDDPEPKEVTESEVASLVARAREAIEALPPGQRAIVALRHYENLSLKEIAEIRGCAVGTVKSTLHQAFTSLRRALGGDVGSLAVAVKRQAGSPRTGPARRAPAPLAATGESSDAMNDPGSDDEENTQDSSDEVSRDPVSSDDTGTDGESS